MKIRKAEKITLIAIVCLWLVSAWLRSGSAVGESEVHVSLAPETLFVWQGLPITNAFLWNLCISIVLIVLAFAGRLFITTGVPGRFQNGIEWIVEGFFRFITTITGSEEKTRKIFPLAFTMFVFILCANLFTFLPGSSAITIGDKPLFRAVASDYNVVLLLTLITVVTVQIASIITEKPLGYLKKFINFSSPLNFVLGIMDIIGELSKLLSLSFRLFGNIFAGEVLGAVMLFLMPYFLPLPFMFMGLLTAVIQAFVFALLTVIFLSMATQKTSHTA